MPNSQKAALLIAGSMTLVALYLLLYRGGLLAGIMTVAGVALLLKCWLRPGSNDPALTAATAAVGALTWAGIFYYVITTWESGEVVELTIDTAHGTHSARVWVLAIDGSDVVYYDAPPEAAESMLAGTPLQMTRAGEKKIWVPHAKDADSLPQQEANKVLAAMNDKYGERVRAADVFYLMLGRPTGRTGVVAQLVEASD